MRKIGFVLVGLLMGTTMLVLAPSRSESQGRGGPPGGGDPMMFFNMLSKGKDVIVRSELDQRGQFVFDRMAEKMGGAAGGQITKDQYMQAQQNRQQGGGSSGGPPRGYGGGGPPMQPMGGSAPVVMQPMGGSPMGSTPQIDPEKQARLERWGEDLFRQADRNKDGLLDYEEMSDTVRAERDRWDTNRDGFIDAQEYKPYIVAWVAKREEDRNGGRKNDGGNNNNNNNQPNVVIVEQQPMQEEEEARPTVIRAGKLPKETPLWFTSTDKDGDGQIMLYEWRTAGKVIREFQDMDRNGDGLLTVEETIWFARTANERAKQLANAEGAQPAVFGQPGGGGKMFGGGRDKDKR